VVLKPGYKTSEFWVTTLATLGAIVAASADWLPPRYAALVAGAAQGLYALSRGLAKLGATLGPVPTQPVSPPPVGPPQA